MTEEEAKLLRKASLSMKLASRRSWAYGVLDGLKAVEPNLPLNEGWKSYEREKYEEGWLEGAIMREEKK